MTSGGGQRGVAIVGAVLGSFGLAATAYGAVPQFVAARFNNEGGVRNLDGSSDEFGAIDAAINFIPLGVTLLVATGIGLAFANRNFYAAGLLGLAQLTWLFGFAPGPWIS